MGASLCRAKYACSACTTSQWSMPGESPSWRAILSAAARVQPAGACGNRKSFGWLSPSLMASNRLVMAAPSIRGSERLISHARYRARWYINYRRRRKSDAAGRLGQAAVLGDRLHRTGHPEPEQEFLVFAGKLGELAYRRHNAELFVVLARLLDMVPLHVVQRQAVRFCHGAADFRRPRIAIEKVAVAVAFWNCHRKPRLIVKTRTPNALYLNALTGRDRCSTLT